MAPAEPRRFLLVGHNAGGTVPPMLALAQAMVRRGHDVTWLSQPSVRDRAVAAGCRFEPLAGLGDYDTGTAIEEQLELAMVGIAGLEIGEQLIARVEQHDTDAVVVDCNLASAAAAAESLDAPSALLFHSMFKTFSDVWFGELWPFLAPAVNDARRAFGVDPAGSWNETFAGHDRLISVVPGSFDAPVADAPGTLRHFGFLVPEPSADNAVAGFPDGDGPTVLVSLSTTYQQQEDLLARVVEALAGRAVRGLVTTGGHGDASYPRGAGQRDGLRLPRSRSGAPRDRRVDHPRRARDGGRRSQPWRADGLRALSDATSTSTRSASPRSVPESRSTSEVGSAEIGDALDDVLADASYRRSAEKIASASADAGGASAVVDDLESFLLT